MNVLVTGATGFVGRYVVAELASRNHEVTIATRRAVSEPIAASVREIDGCNLQDWRNMLQRVGTDYDAVVHLAWSGLPDYRNIAHVEDNVGPGYRLLEAFVTSGVQRVLVTGTCLEYGMQEGCLDETVTANPGTAYGVAKDALRKLLQQLQNEHDFTLTWARLFYVYGEGQNPRSLYSQLASAVRNGEKSFPMSAGDQLRDFLPIQVAATQLVNLIESESASGIVNCCSGKPTSVLSLVRELISEFDSDIEPMPGHYPYPDYEPRNFWGANEKYTRLIACGDDGK